MFSRRRRRGAAMSEIETLQRQFAVALTATDAVYEHAVSFIADQIDGGTLPAPDRLRIHRNNRKAALAAALAATYPALRRLVGDPFFARVADQYGRVRPPTEPCLDRYGGRFAEFLETFDPVASLAYLPDVARFEWARHEVAYESDACPVDRSLLAGMVPDADHLRLQLIPAIRWLVLAWPADTVWAAQFVDEPPILELEPGEICLEVWRVGDSVQCRRIDHASWAFRTAIRRGESLATAAASALARDPFFDLTIDLYRLFREELVTGFALTGSVPQEQTT